MNHLTDRQVRRSHLIAAAPDLAAVARAYEQWEADLILCNAAWETRGEQAAILTQGLYDRLMEIQAMRNAALAKVEGRS